MIYKSYISQLVMHAHDTADNINTLLWAPSVSQRTSYETSMDSAYTQLIGPLISHASSSYRHKFFLFHHFLHKHSAIIRKNSN